MRRTRGMILEETARLLAAALVGHQPDRDSKDPYVLCAQCSSASGSLAGVRWPCGVLAEAERKAQLILQDAFGRLEARGRRGA